jgi:hypothetical protein
MLLILSQMGSKDLELLKRKMVLYLMSQNNKLNSLRIFLHTPRKVEDEWISKYLNAKLYLIYLRQRQDHNLEAMEAEEGVVAIEAEVAVDMVAEEVVAVAMEVEVEVVVIMVGAAVAVIEEAAAEEDTTEVKVMELASEDESYFEFIKLFSLFP